MEGGGQVRQALCSFHSDPCITRDQVMGHPLRPPALVLIVCVCKHIHWRMGLDASEFGKEQSQSKEANQGHGVCRWGGRGYCICERPGRRCIIFCMFMGKTSKAFI